MTESKTASEKKVDASEKKLNEVLPPFEIAPEEHVDYSEREPDRIIPKKGDDGYDTPSGYALNKVGEFKGDPVADQAGAKAHGHEYLYQKMLKRWGLAPRD